MVIALIGTKIDLDSERTVSTQEGQTFADQNGLLFIEVSAKNAINVDKAFLLTAKKIIDNIEKGAYDLTNENSGIKMGSSFPKQMPKEKKCDC